MKKENIVITSDFDGLKLDTLIYIPDEVKGIFQIAHGMSENKERYEYFLNALCKAGYVACINDHRGHGKSVKDESDYGYFYDGTGKAVVDDIHQITLYLKKRFPNVPVTLFGHSMGSLVVRAYTSKYDKDIDNLIVCGSPSYNSASGFALKLLSFLKLIHGSDRAHSKLMDKLSTGNNDSKFPGTEVGRWLSVNEQNVKDYNANPLCGFSFTINGYQSLMHLMRQSYGKEGWNLNNPDLKILFISGGDDPCMGDKESWLKAIEDIKAKGYQNVESKLYEGYRHEILNEEIRDDVISDILDYIK